MLDGLLRRITEPPPDDGLWSSRKVAGDLAEQLGPETVAVRRGWDALQAVGWFLRRPRPKSPKSASDEEAEAFETTRRHARRGADRASRHAGRGHARDEHRIGLKPVIHRAWAPIGERPIALGHRRFKWPYAIAFVAPRPATEWYLSNGVSKPFFEVLAAFAHDVGAGPNKRVVLLLDNAGWHTLPNLDVPQGLRLVSLPPYSLELQPAEPLWTLVDEPIVNKHIPNIAELEAVIAKRCIHLIDQRDAIKSRTAFHWWPKQSKTKQKTERVV